MDPELEQSAAGASPVAPNTENSPATPPPEAAVDEGPEDQNSPLDGMSVEGAENGGSIVYHHPRVSDRVKKMGYGKPRKHVMKDDEELASHMKKHAHRLQK